MDSPGWLSTLTERRQREHRAKSDGCNVDREVGGEGDDGESFDEDVVLEGEEVEELLEHGRAAAASELSVSDDFGLSLFDDSEYRRGSTLYAAAVWSWRSESGILLKSIFRCF